MTNPHQQHDDQADAEQAAIDEWARDLVSTWPPLSERQRERLRVLFDLSDEYREA